ncbi:type VI secretion system accessory protein TagJ [uncultured Roseobacter sp.]|uniref:type VI secretion system accessory protein TagJ n=1 Tax=uncultured Roseobacter sp. TaxID=114847 RepID=UPI0026389E64|nr:type VI secretion system accessory protein TagJ [uncultured Roseobacter sp.]
MSAQNLLKTGDLFGALTALEAAVRAAPADARLRVFLFQLLSVAGDWPRAARQLQTATRLDPAAAPMAETYSAAIHCERSRDSALRGETPAPFDEDASSWLSVLWDAVGKQAASDVAGAERLRAMALRAAPAVGGTVNGRPFDWIADADSRFGPVFEVILNGTYRWLPFADLREIRMSPPQDLRDLIWAPVALTLACGTQAGGLVPVRYPATAFHGTDAQKLARSTDWLTVPGGAPEGLGQRMLCTPDQDIPLLELREITFEQSTRELAPLQEARHG